LKRSGANPDSVVPERYFTGMLRPYSQTLDWAGKLGKAGEVGKRQTLADNEHL
jgi:hypothetical protein